MAKNNIMQGKTINKKDICLVCKNNNVILLLESGNVYVSLEATALEDGMIDDYIKVATKNNDEAVTAKVTNQKTVKKKLY